jgi:uncharacterized membrane protein YjjP (DUF1212 family)
MVHGQWFANSIASFVGVKAFYLSAYANKKLRLNFVATGSLCPGLDYFQ